MGGSFDIPVVVGIIGEDSGGAYYMSKNLEIERRFIVNDISDIPVNTDLPTKARLIQGYLPGSSFDGLQARVRYQLARQSNGQLAVTFSLNMKSGYGLTRTEIEIGLAVQQFNHLFRLCDRYVEKMRWKLGAYYQGGDGGLLPVVIEINEFAGRHDGLILAEIEFDFEEAEWKVLTLSETLSSMEYINKNMFVEKNVGVFIYSFVNYMFQVGFPVQYDQNLINVSILIGELLRLGVFSELSLHEDLIFGFYEGLVESCNPIHEKCVCLVFSKMISFNTLFFPLATMCISSFNEEESYIMCFEYLQALCMKCDDMGEDQIIPMIDLIHNVFQNEKRSLYNVSIWLLAFIIKKYPQVIDYSIKRSLFRITCLLVKSTDIEVVYIALQTLKYYFMNKQFQFEYVRKYLSTETILFDIEHIDTDISVVSIQVLGFLILQSEEFCNHLLSIGVLETIETGFVDFEILIKFCCIEFISKLLSVMPIQRVLCSSLIPMAFDMSDFSSSLGSIFLANYHEALICFISNGNREDLLLNLTNSGVVEKLEVLCSESNNVIADRILKTLLN
ncbi:MAG: hypothetical protein UT75_C0003G0002 [Candidatus Yanofskybacteria bacterium GW2011_GWE2_40_11]|uniref:Uncharacterized protein n=1 Tax=Candidatus Yanofskybacteria bacterium GW2011_GWE2_40_11 TaxID=1619033 RepID=A0A0G0TSM8_9BACT|nr:MAG: hypothetical protein UT75_C0003G0002 [Candidatus Yanofskybacteria bacterium GW2011_GWE2_40_11]